MIRFQIRGAMRWRTRMYAYCRRIHAPLSLLSSWKLVMQSALFAPTPSTSSPPVRSETAILIRLFHLPSFQALFTRQTAPLTSSSPSYHSSVGDDTGILELKERITRPTDRLGDWNGRGQPSFATLSWKELQMRTKQIEKESEGAYHT